MLKAEAIAHYETATKLAETLGVGKALVSKWPDKVPPRYQYELERLTEGELVAEWPPADRPNMIVPKNAPRRARRSRSN